MGGPLLWPADEPWPACDDARLREHADDGPVPLVPVLQVYAHDTGGIYVFTCVKCPHRPDGHRFDCS